MADTQATVTHKGKPVTLVGRGPKVGELAPDFELLGNDMSAVKLSDFNGKVCVICSVTSLDTSVCDTEVRKFNEHATSLGDNVVVLVISMDLPFAQKRWCGAEGIKNVQTLSDHRKAEFGNKYGVLVKELRLLARSVFVVDGEGFVRYIEIVNEIANEPDYEAALEAVRKVKK